MIDAHCHLDFERFDADREALLAAARAVGVRRWLCAGVRPGDWDRQAALEAAEDGVASCFGIHPHVAARMGADDLAAAMDALAARARLAVGETGLDGSRYVPRGSHEAQFEAFRAQLALARERDLPVVLHVLQAHGATLDVLERDGVPAAGGMVHSYSGSAELVARYEKLGLYVSFSGSITRPGAKKVRAAAMATSPDRLLVETDCPDQVPTGVVGGRNLPEYLPRIVKSVAAARDEPWEDVARRTAENAARLFDWR